MGYQNISPQLHLRICKKASQSFLAGSSLPGPCQTFTKLQAIQHLLDIRVMEPIPPKAKFKVVYSIFFLVPKKSGEIRAILDLKWLNKFLIRKKFKMETWRSIMAALDWGDFLTSVDLSEAYLHSSTLAITGTITSLTVPNIFSTEHSPSDYQLLRGYSPKFWWHRLHS